MKYLRLMALLAAVSAVLFLFAACGQSPARKPNGFPIEVGGVSFSSAPKRVVSLSPSLTDSVGLLGFGSRLMGVSDNCDSPSARGLPSCGTGLEPDITQILSLSPDLVLCSAQLPEETLLTFQQNGIETLVLPRADSLDGIYQNWGDLCRLFTGTERGTLSEEQLRHYGGVTLDYIGGALSENQEDGLAAVYLRRLPSAAATGDSYEGQLLTTVGFQNPATGSAGWFYAPGEETPPEIDLIFCDASVSPDSLAQDSFWGGTAAVQNGRVFLLDGTSLERQSPALFAVFEGAVRDAFPECFSAPKPSVLLPRPQEPEPEPGWWEKLASIFGR